MGGGNSVPYGITLWQPRMQTAFTVRQAFADTRPDGRAALTLQGVWKANVRLEKPWRWEDPINRSHTNPPPRYVVSGGNDDSIPVVFVLPTTCKNISVGSLGLFRGKGSLG